MFGKYDPDRSNNFSIFIGSHGTGRNRLSGSPRSAVPSIGSDWTGVFGDAPITEGRTVMDVGNICVVIVACTIGIVIFYKIWIAENRFDVFTDKYKTYQYDLVIRCGEQEEPVKVTMYSDARYSDPWLLFQGYQRGRTVKGTLTIRIQERIWSCPVHAISSITMTVSKRGEGVT